MDSPQAGLKALGERVQAALEAETQPTEQLRIARAGLLERAGSTARRQRASRTRRWTIALAAAGVLGLGLAVALGSWRAVDAPLSFETSLGERGLGDVLEAGSSAPVRVTFSEGTRVLLQPGSRARVLATQERGARVLLEGGALDVAVVHRERTRWSFEAGPFHVLVKGTEFELGWQPAQQQLSLNMKSGKVEVSGSCLPAPRVAERGARLTLSCAPADAARAERAPAASRADSSAQAAGAATPGARAAGQSAREQPRPDHAGVPAAPSFEESCERASKAELVAWANRERLSGRGARARSALLALRKRFAGSSEAQTAAFTLGRMTFEQADYDEAARWFASYLDEQPNGPLMGDAAGRLIEAHQLQGNRAAARRAAQAYLRRFPDGPYAAKASRILAE